MAYFPQVYKGQSFAPSVLEENNIRQNLNRAYFFNDSDLSRGFDSNVVISVYNAYDETIPAMTAVAISSYSPVVEDAFPCVPYTSNQRKWGILLSDLEPGEIGSYLVSGIADVNCSGNGDFVMPSPGDPAQYIPSASGAAVIAYNSESKIAKIALGVGSGSGEEYSGYFKVAVENEQVVIFDGMRPDSEIAGYTDLPEAKEVKKTFLPLSQGSYQYVYLLACHTEADGYSIKISFSNRDASSFYNTLLARISPSAEVTQVYKSSDTLIFSKDFYL